jgi:hypothetical protein
MSIETDSTPLEDPKILILAMLCYLFLLATEQIAQ